MHFFGSLICRSRLACMVKVSEKFAGKTIEVPLPLYSVCNKHAYMIQQVHLNSI